MTSMIEKRTAEAEDSLRALARTAAAKVLSRDRTDLPVDPRDPRFASEYIQECDRLLAATPLLLQDALESAGHAAEGTNVDPYQGVVEVMQNAEDRQARDVRVMLREAPSGRQMLIAHNGLPVEYEHVLAMMLPFVSTKCDDADQRGRFGIGLKTLRRICTDIQVHGSPYHFGSGAAVSIVERAPEPAVADFYDPTLDTLLVLDLEGDFDQARFEAWFAEWSDDGLIFLDHVRRFAFHHDAQTVTTRETKATGWSDVAMVGDDLIRLERRTVTAGSRRYLVHRGLVAVPDEQERFHKRTGTTTAISVATAGVEEAFGLFVALRTRIPTALPFALDAQFDPIASREGIQDNKWNSWLLHQVGHVLAEAAASAIADERNLAWNLIAVPGEGVREERWPADALDEALDLARTNFAALVRFGTDKDHALAGIAYEAVTLSALLTESDVVALAPDHLSLAEKLRDRRGRWRTVVDALAVARRIETSDLIGGIAGGLFAAKSDDWWVETVAALTQACEPAQLLGAPIWRTNGDRLVAAEALGTSDRKLVFGAPLPPLSQRHDLFDVLHPAFGTDAGRLAIDWLVKHAAFTVEVDTRDELLAFATAFENDPVRVEPEDLRELRDLLNPITDARAHSIGQRLGAAILIEAVEAETKGKRSWRRPSELYLPKAIDKDTPYWPTAAAGLAGIHWVHPMYDEGLRTGLGKRRKREDGIRSRGARNFLTLLGTETGPRLETGLEAGPRSEARRASMRKAEATSLAADIRSDDIDKVLRFITNKKMPKTERKERATALLRALSRDWSRRLQDQSTVEGQHSARKYTYTRGRHDALWLDRLKEIEWIPVGRDRFRRPADAAIKTGETQAIYRAEDFVAGIAADELDEDFIEALGLKARASVDDLLTMIEDMRDGAESFDLARVLLAYQHFARLVPKTGWYSAIGDVSMNEFRSRFAAGEGLVLIMTDERSAEWRRPGQVRRGRQIVPHTALYAIDRDSLRPLWKALNIGETSVEDCCDYLRTHAERVAPDADLGTVITLYRYLNGLLAGKESFPVACRHIPLACTSGWRARRPIYLVDDAVLRQRLAAALPETHFWQPPCDTRSIGTLVTALAVQRIEPRVRPRNDQRAVEQGEDQTPTFQAAVDHLSNVLGQRDAMLRQALKVSWEALRAARLFVYDGEVPVDVDASPLARAIRTGVPAHVRLDPLEIHITADALETREGAGAAIASLFDGSALFSFDAEWILAWQAAKHEVKEALRFAVDDAAHKAKVEATAAEIAKKGNGPVKLNGRKMPKNSPPPPPPPPPRELKEFQPGIASVEIVEGKKTEKTKKPPIRTRLSRRPSPNRPNQGDPVANTAYTNGEIEDFAWDVLLHVLDRADGTELEDFRRRHGVGADGAFDWSQFVELKATGRSMQTSVLFTSSEFQRALERRNDYILALVHGCEKGSNTKVKLIFDPVRRVSMRETEGIRLNGLPDAAGIVIELGQNGAMSSVEEGSPSTYRG